MNIKNNFFPLFSSINQSKRNYLTALAVFLTFMYIMGFVEHYFETSKIASADTCSLEETSLEYWIERKGTVTGNEIRAYLTPAGIMLAEGDIMSVKAAGTDPVELPIQRLSYNAEKDIITAYFKIKKGAYAEDSQVIVSKSQKTRKYFCIPAEAVRQDELGHDFIYLVQEKKSILGNELVCKMKYITILSEDTNYAAIDLDHRISKTAGLKTSDLIVLHADRNISEGSKIHLLE